MDTAKWAQVSTLFHELIDLSPEEQQRALAQIRNQYDPTIVEEVSHLLGEARKLDKDFLEMSNQDYVRLLRWVMKAQS